MLLDITINMIALCDSGFQKARYLQNLATIDAGCSSSADADKACNVFLSEEEYLEDEIVAFQNVIDHMVPFRW